MIVKVKGGYKVRSRTKGLLSKRPKSQREAFDQLYAVQMSKMRRGKISKKEVRRSMKNARKGH